MQTYDVNDKMNMIVTNIRVCQFQLQVIRDKNLWYFYHYIFIIDSWFKIFWYAIYYDKKLV